MEKVDAKQADELAHLRRALDRAEARLRRAQAHADERERVLLATQAECDRMRLSRSWRLTAPLRYLSQQVRNMAIPRPNCGLFSRLAMLGVLLPVLPRYYNGVGGAFRALRRGKAAFGEVLDRAPRQGADAIPEAFMDRLQRLLLVFALRIRRNGGVIPALYRTRQALRAFGKAGLYMLAEPQESGPGLLRQSRLKDVLSLLATAEPGSDCPEVTVVVPVYNGLAHLERLCPTLFAHSSPAARFVFVDDASPDPAVGAFLQTHVADRPDCVLLRNEHNLGFVRTVNRGMEAVHTPYAVWLNTDVVVPEHWLERLLAPFAQDARIASTTPFTNSAVYFSYPVVGTDNAIAEGTTPEELDRAFARLSPAITERCDIHSGVGFCMGVNMACWKAIGPLDAEAFDRGYGEECDWCMRATSQGWRNVLAPNLFVYHAHGGSFTSAEKQALINAHLEVLHTRWPRQMAAVVNHEQTDPWEAYRALASLLLASPDAAAGAVLMVDVALEVGGACAYREKVLATCTAQGRRVLLLQFTLTNCRWTLRPRYLGAESVIHLDTFDDIRAVFDLVPIDEIFINNLAYCEEVEHVLVTLEALKQPHMRLTYAFHDFFSVCPSYFLLDKQNRFCAGGDELKCVDCIVNNPNAILSRYDAELWRSYWRPFLAQCDELRFFSETTRTIASGVYPEVSRGLVIEHEPLKAFETTYTLPDKDAPLVIAFLGPFIIQKGADVLKDLARELKTTRPGASLMTFGDPHGNVDGAAGIRHNGPYMRSALPDLLTRKGVKAVVFPSLWPETFSYIAQECAMMGVPFVCFDIGAPAERIRKYGVPRCAIAPEFTAQSLLHTVESLLDSVYAAQARPPDGKTTA